MRKYFSFSKKEGFYLLVIALSWLLLGAVKQGILSHVETLPLPLSLFWMGTGCLMALFFLNWLLRQRALMWKVHFKGLPLALCGLLAFQLYFFHAPGGASHFFMWVPLLYWPASMIFYGGERKLIRFRLFLAAIFIAALLIGVQLIPMTATLFLVAFNLMAFKRRENIFAFLMPGILLQIVVAGGFSLFHWQGEGSIPIMGVVASLIGGFVVGLSIALLLRSLQFFKIENSLIAISTCFLAHLTLPKESVVPLLFFMAVIFHYLRKGRGQAALQVHRST